MEKLVHWTQSSPAGFVYEISSTFVAQLETRMEKEKITRSQLASRLKKTTGRVSQVFNDPGNLGLKLIVEYARELGMKVSIVAYDDGDPKNEKGPINPDVFVKCWEKLGCPANLFEAEGTGRTSVVTSAITANVAGAATTYFGFSYTSMPNEGKTVGGYFTANAIALDSSASIYFPPKPLDSAPHNRKEGKVA